MRQVVRVRLGRQQFIDHLDEIMAAGYSVSVFTEWADESRIWLKLVDDAEAPPPRWLGTVAARAKQAPILGADPRAATTQLNRPGPWYARLPHFRPEFTPSWGEELQTEYFVARADAPAALETVFGLAGRLAPVLHVSEIRAVAGDSCWTSPAEGGDRIALHFTWHADPAAVVPLVTELERRLAPFAARPHWGKVFAVEPSEMACRNPRLAEFAALARTVDPTGKFSNEFLRRYVYSL
jgi:xylitol oxidase